MHTHTVVLTHIHSYTHRHILLDTLHSEHLNKIMKLITFLEKYKVIKGAGRAS